MCQFVDLDKICGVAVNEAITFSNVVYSLVLMVDGQNDMVLPFEVGVHSTMTICVLALMFIMSIRDRRSSHKWRSCRRFSRRQRGCFFPRAATANCISRKTSHLYRADDSVCAVTPFVRFNATVAIKLLLLFVVNFTTS